MSKMVCERWCVTKSCVKDGCDKVVWKMVCDKVVCERWCDKAVCERRRVTKLRVKDCVWQSCVWKMVCQRWWVTKWCVKDGVCVCVWQSWGSRMVCDKVVCERWCVKDDGWQSGVWKMVCVKDGVWQSSVWKRVCERWHVTKMVCERVLKEGVSKMVCERRCVTKWWVKDGVWQRWCVTPEPAQCHKCHAGHAKRKGMSPSATCASRNEGGCHQAPRLPRKVPRRHRRPMQSKRATRASPVPHGTWRHLPWFCVAGVALRFAWQVQHLATSTLVLRGRRGTWRHLPSFCVAGVSATPATQSAAASPATNAVQARHQSQPNGLSATPATQNEGGCHQVPRLPRETKVDVAKCHAMQSKRATRASPVP